MQHRGTARRRVMIVEGTGDLPASGTEIKANERPIGTLASVSASDGLAIVRTDRVKDALDAGHAITAGGVPLTLSIPSWAKYTLPQEADAAEGA
jgi:folate-binding Fe-S cluster repair protein YgfZ